MHIHVMCSMHPSKEGRKEKIFGSIKKKCGGVIHLVGGGHERNIIIITIIPLACLCFVFHVTPPPKALLRLITKSKIYKNEHHQA